MSTGIFPKKIYQEICRFYFIIVTQDYQDQANLKV